MKVVHLPFCFYPDAVGGTEIYVEALTRELKALGVDNLIAAPAKAADSYLHEGLPVRRFPTGSDRRDLLPEIYGAGDTIAAQAVGRILDEEKPDVVHLHAFTGGVSLRVVWAASERRIPVFLTYHTPTVSCQRGTLLRQGREVCEGRLELRRCVDCVLEKHGIGQPGRTLLSRLPKMIGQGLGSAGFSGGVWTAARMTSLVSLRQESVRALFREVNGIVALCEWTKRLLLLNGVPEGKITISRHGLAQPFALSASPSPSLSAKPLRVAFLGRADRTKGVDTLIRAIQSVPELEIELHLHGIAQGTADETYWRELQAMVAGDSRITFRPALPGPQVIAALRHYHLLAVPSRWLETGPLVVLEAFAAGIPVIGSDLGGIAELVQHEGNGLLVEPDNPSAWSAAFTRLCQDETLQPRLQAQVKPPRSMKMVAAEMKALYHTALAP